MPVFLIPIVAGGYYYFKTMKEKVRGEPLQEQDATLSSGDTNNNDEVDLASSSIEVSIVMPPSTLENEGEEMKTIQEEEEEEEGEEEDADENGVKSQVILHRKGSSDTAQTEVSDEEAEDKGGILGATCGGCDQESLFELVECGTEGNSLEKRIAVVFSQGR